MVAWLPRAEESRNQATRSRSGGAFAASNAGYASELWGHHGALNSFASKNITWSEIERGFDSF